MHSLGSPPQRVLITGASGFVGDYLIDALVHFLGENLTCIAWAESTTPDPDPGRMVSWETVDIRDPRAVDKAIQLAEPTVVIHLAAISHVPTSFKDPEAVWQVNTLGTLHLLESIQRHAPEALTIVVSSSEVYGNSFKSRLPLNEAALLAPRNPYATSKSAADLLAGQYADMQIIRMRPFNHIGPRQRADFVVPAFASQIARIEKGYQPPVLKVGNIEAKRDMLHVRDVVKAYVLSILERDNLASNEIFNICSGISHSIKDILEKLLTMTKIEINVEVDETRYRPSDIPVAIGDPTHAIEKLGWKPEISIDDALVEVLEYWRNTV